MTHYLEPNQVPDQLRRGYAGRKFQVKVCEQMTIPADAGLWSGGSRSVFTAVDLVTGNDDAPTLSRYQRSSPFGDVRREITVNLEPGKAIVEHVTFCGKDMGLRFYLHPSNVDALKIEAAPDLDPVERIVLIATRSLKSSYNGKDRFQMAVDDLSYKSRFAVAGSLNPKTPVIVPTRDDWNAAKARLIARKLLNKAGAITTAGKNAIGDDRL
jgi:hypothetical protein